MPSRLAPTDFRRARSARALAEQDLDTLQELPVIGPWGGYTPDLNYHTMDFNGCTQVLGLVARSDITGGQGEVLTHDDGFNQIDSGNLPLKASTPVVRVDKFNFTDELGVADPASDESPTSMALVAGDGSTPGSFEVWRIDNQFGTWLEVDRQTSTTVNPEARRDGDWSAIGASPSVQSMPDSTTFAFGALTREAQFGLGGDQTLSKPVWIFTNNVDNVMVYPADDTLYEYADLIDWATDAGGAANNFRCVSVESFGGRVYFFNTFEDDSRHSQRLRRSIRGDANPNPSGVGAGFIDFEQFAGQGLRAETLGTVLACYFEDGTAFVYETGNLAAPNGVRILDERRGLLGTHAVIRVGDNKHFGLFEDGWWFLDSSGRWEQAGTQAVGGNVLGIGGGITKKWQQSFYGKLDQDYLARIQLGYDPQKNWVRIIFPVSGETDVNEVWIYDIDNDRVWIDRYPITPTCWGLYEVTEDTALTYDTVDAALTFEDVAGTYASLAPQFSRNTVVHGNDQGFVMKHDPNIITKATATAGSPTIPSFLYRTVASALGKPMYLKTAERTGMQYIVTDNATRVSIQVFDSRGNTETYTRAMNRLAVGGVDRARAPFKLTEELLGFQISGTGPVIIKAFDFRWFDEDVREIYE